MRDILIPGQHTIIGGLASNYQSFIGRELVFADVVSKARPQAIFLVDSPADCQNLIQQFDIWRQARAVKHGGDRVRWLDGFRHARTADGLCLRIDKVWNFSPSPLIVADLSHHIVNPNYQWFEWAPDLAAAYRAKVLTIANLGPHKVAAIPLRDLPADAHWQCEANGTTVALTDLADKTTLKFTGRNVTGGMIFYQQELEGAHA